MRYVIIVEKGKTSFGASAPDLSGCVAVAETRDEASETMRTINTKATVMADGKITMQLPPDVLPGEHQIVLVIDEQPIQLNDRLPLKFSAYPVGIASEDFTARREDL